MEANAVEQSTTQRHPYVWLAKRSISIGILMKPTGITEGETLTHQTPPRFTKPMIDETSIMMLSWCINLVLGYPAHQSVHCATFSDPSGLSQMHMSATSY
jgi:hypothetical protein